MIKVWCEECEGSGKIGGGTIYTGDYVEGEECTKCNGKGHINPPQQVLDELECAEIERELLTKSYRIEYGIWKDLASVIISMAQFEEYVFSGKTKIEALRNAKERIEQKG